MPKILLVAPRISGVSGIAQHVRQLAKRLKKMGWDVHLLSSETMRLKSRKGLANIEYAFSSAAKCLKREYEVAHGHNLPSILALKAVKAKAKIITLHGIYSKQIELLYGDFLGYVARLAEKFLLRWADAVTAVTRDAANYYRSLKLEAEYIPNAVDFSELPTEHKRITTPQITYLGRLSREKGVDLLLTLASMGIRGIAIAGDGPMRPLVERASRKGLVYYLGPLPRNEALKILAGSDIFILPSRAEGVSTALLEAMALKIPVVTTRITGNIEVVQDGYEAILVHPRVEEIVNALRILLEDRDYAKKIAENAYRRVTSAFSWDIVQEHYLKIYESILSQR